MKREAAARTAAVGPGLARPTLAKVLVPSCRRSPGYWGVADLWPHLDARFGSKVPVGWHPPQASPAGFTAGMDGAACADPVKREDR